MRHMCNCLHVEQDSILHKAKMLLCVYHDVIWVSLRKADTLREEAALYGNELNVALAYLSDFAPYEKKREFEERVSGLFETKWMIGLIDTAMKRVKEYHTNGASYYEILAKCYLSSKPLSESEILEQLNIERSIFYERKKEAVLLFGIAMWGFAIPALRGTFASWHDSVPGFFLEVPD